VLLGFSRRRDCTVVTVRGRLDTAAAPSLQSALLKAVADGPRAVVCDLRPARSVEPVALTVLPTVARYAATWTDTPVSACASHPAVLGQLHRLAIDRWMTVATSVELATAGGSRVPSVARIAMRLHPVPTAPDTARTFVVEACRRWDVSELARPASLLAMDLAGHVLLRADGEMELRATLWDDQLHLSTRHRPAEGKQPAVAEPPAVVRALARFSGVMTTSVGDVVTWCLLGVPHRHARGAVSQQLLPPDR
jgi:anti-anti-sigma regulatory factor